MKLIKRSSGRAVLLALLMLVVTATTSISAIAAATVLPPRAPRCQALVGGVQVGPIPHECGPKSAYTFARLDGFMPGMPSTATPSVHPVTPKDSAHKFRGWARVASYSDCRYDIFSNPVVCGGAPVDPNVGRNLTAYRYSAHGWNRTTLPRGTWVWAQHYSGDWEWAYTNGSWYAMSKGNLEAYCQRGYHSHSNCTLVTA